MPDTFTVTIISIIVFTVIAAFIKGRIRDKCLKEFSGHMVTIECASKSIWGILRVENTGLEIVFEEQEINKYTKSSYIMYKQEFSEIEIVVRFIDKLSEAQRIKRGKKLKKAYHPSFIRRFFRSIVNSFKTVRDSLADAANLITGKMKASSPLQGSIANQGKYSDKLKNEFLSSFDTSYEPLLERHIGRRVVVEVLRAGNKLEYSGILRDYTSEFIELMDIDYPGNDTLARADIVVPRKNSTVRHLGE